MRPCFAYTQAGREPGTATPLLQRPTLSESASTATERLLLAAMVALVPVQSNLPLWHGFSFVFLLFGLLLAHQLVFRPKSLMSTLLHPLSLAVCAFLAVIAVIEAMHDNPEMGEILRIGFMICGAIVCASMCRDRRAFSWGIHGYILGSAIVSTILILSMYGRLSIAPSGSDFYDVSVTRMNAFHGSALRDNLNALAFYASQGAILTAALVLTARNRKTRIILLSIGSLCLFASFLSMSRGVIVILVFTFFCMLRAHGIMNPRVLLGGLAVTAILFIWMPSVVFQRMTVSSEASTTEKGFKDSRVLIYKEIINKFPEYIMTGVGSGNFYGDWGRQTQFYLRGREVTGVHNCAAQVAINWGVLGLVLFLLILRLAYKRLQKREYTDAIRLSILGLAASALVWSMFIHELQRKEFSIALGFLIASDRAGVAARLRTAGN